MSLLVRKCFRGESRGVHRDWGRLGRAYREGLTRSESARRCTPSHSNQCEQDKKMHIVVWNSPGDRKDEETIYRKKKKTVIQTSQKSLTRVLFTEKQDGKKRWAS